MTKKDKEYLLRMEPKLFEQLSPGATAIINLDQPYGRKLIKMVKAKTLTYGLKKTAQIRAERIKLGLAKSSFQVCTPRGKIDITTALIGKYNLYNILAALSVAFAEGIDFFAIAAGVRALSFVPGRLERIDCGQSFFVFVDYAHTEDALEKLLQNLRSLSKKRIILAFGCGGDRDKSKRPKMGRLACKLADLVLITSDNPRSEDPRKIIAEIVRGIDREDKHYRVVLDRAQAIFEALAAAGKGDLVVIAGKGHESSQILAKAVIPFDDREVIKQILPCLKSKKYCKPLKVS